MNNTPGVQGKKSAGSSAIKGDKMKFQGFTQDNWNTGGGAAAANALLMAGGDFQKML